MKLRWVEPDEPLPAAELALADPNGLLAAGRDLSGPRLLQAYRGGIFPWFSEGQPVLWWSPDPRMVLPTSELRIRSSLAQRLRQIRRQQRWRISRDTAFEQVMRECARPRPDQDGTWITDSIIAAYTELHQQGSAHSVEIWEDGRLVGGLYGVSIGRMFYGESMFARAPDASKIALWAWVRCLGALDFPMIDCQQSTRHLASLGAVDMRRSAFLAQVRTLVDASEPDWSQVKIDFPSE